MAKDPAFLFYPNDWVGGTMGMSFAEKGAYMELLMMQFNRGHMTLDMIGHAVGQHWGRIEVKFRQDEAGLWYNERLEVEKELRKNYVNSRNNNRNGKNQYTKNKKQDGHTTNDISSRLSTHMEDVNENENINKDDIGGKGGKEGKEEIEDLLDKMLFLIHGVKNISELDEKEKLYPMLVSEMMKIFIEQNPDYFVEIETDYHACLKIAYKIADLQKWNHSVVLNGKMPECLMRWSEIVRFQRQDEYFSQLTLEGIEKNFQKIVKKNSTHGKYSKSSGHRGLASKNTGSEIETPL